MNRTIDQLFRSAISQLPNAQFEVTPAEFETIYRDDSKHGRRYRSRVTVINNKEHWWLGCRLMLVVR